MKGPRKVAVIGLDAMSPTLLRRFSEEGLIPNMTKLMRKGVVSEAYPCLPVGTAMNWASIATGATTGTNGCTGMSIHEFGDPLWVKYTGFDSRNCKAEFLWNAAERAGKTAILLRYTNSWPPTMKSGIHVEGHGSPDYNCFQIAPRLCFSTVKLPERPPELFTTAPKEMPRSYQIRVAPASGWKNVPHSYLPPLEATLTLGLRGGYTKTFHALVLDRKGRGYDTVIVGTSKDASSPCATMKGAGSWSEWVKADFDTLVGRQTGYFRFKLLLLPDKDGKGELRVFTSMIYPEVGWTQPAPLAKELNDRIGPFQDLAGVCQPYYTSWVDIDTVLEEFEYTADWQGRAAEYLLKSYEWDLFFTQWHGIDHIGHAFVGLMDPECSIYDEATAPKALSYVQTTYRYADMMVGRIVDALPDDTVVIITSDHGMVPARKFLYTNNLLAKHGYIEFTVAEEGEIKVDWDKTKAYGLIGSFIYLNVKGREPNGVVDPSEYERVRTEIIKLLQGLRDPVTGDYVMDVVLRSEDAGFMGLHGDRIGDIVYFPKPEYSDEVSRQLVPDLRILHDPDFLHDGSGRLRPFSGIHHPFLPYAKIGMGSNMAVTIFSGPGIRRGVIRPNPIRLIDIAPTAAYILNIPAPANCEGSVIQDILDE